MKNLLRLLVLISVSAVIDPRCAAQDHQSQLSATTAVSALVNDPNVRPKIPAQEILFFDANLASPTWFSSALRPDIEAIPVPTHANAWEKIAATLLDRQGVTAIHFFGHGEPGRQHLGNSILDQTSLANHPSELALLKRALADEGELLLWGCDVAAGDSGQVFIELLAQHTGARVAASLDATGPATLGGNWALERMTASFAPRAPFTTHSLATLPTLLDSDTPTITSATFDVGTGVLIVTGTDLVGTDGSANDIDASKLTLSGDSTAYTLTDTPDVEITSATSFALTLSATDKSALQTRLNKDGTSSINGTTYNLAASENWAPGSTNTDADLTGNAVSVSGSPLPGDVDLDFDPDSSSTVYSTATQADGKILLGGGFRTVGDTTRNNIARFNADGSLDNDFNPNASGSVGTFIVQDDGKILIGGQFRNIGDTPRNRIARLHADGSLDTEFDPNASGSVYSMKMQADGKILIGGSFSTVGGTTRNRIARLNADGSLDTEFDSNADNIVRCIAVQTDGKILIGGQFRNIGDTPRNRIARLHADGSLDTDFDLNASDHVRSMVVQTDGKILLGGSFSSLGDTTRNKIARLNADGSLDTDFDPNTNSNAYSITLQADGKILLGGQFKTVGGTPRNNIARLHADGSLDTGFDPNASSTVYSVAVQADGKILLGGFFTSIGDTARNRIARLANDAATQTLSAPNMQRVQWLRGGAAPEASAVTFELSTDSGANWTALGAGTRITGGWELTGLSLPTDGSLRARARTTSGRYSTSSGLVEQVLAFSGLTGSPTVTPPTSATITSVSSTLGGDVTAENGSTVTERGIVYAATSANSNPQIDGTAVSKVVGSGTTGAFTVDVTGLTPGTTYSYAAFATNGFGTSYSSVATFTTPLSTNAELSALALSTGTLSPAFASGTTSYTATVPYATASITLTPTVAQDNAIVTVNATAVTSGNASGALNLAIGTNTLTTVVTAQDGTSTKTYTVTVTRSAPLPGDVDLDFDPAANFTVFSIAEQANNKILLGGSFTRVSSTTRNGIARLNADGSLDTEFNPNANNSSVFSTTVQDDGRIIIGGQFRSIGDTPRNRIARLHADGSLDTEFDPNVSNTVYSTTVQADGKIIIGGQFSTVGETPRNRIARLHADGSLDTEFDPNVGGSRVFSMAVQADGKILIGGRFTTVGGTTRNNIARLHADGSLDTEFDPNINDWGRGIVVQADGKILIAGRFTTVGSTTRNGIARLHADGSLDTDFDPNASGGTVFSTTVQADGKILFGGSFTTVGETPRNHIARLHADGSLDTTFDPNANDNARSIAVLSDGKILIGGSFVTVGGTTRYYIARLANDDATQTLSAPNMHRVQWLRGGAAPEASAVTFELSTDSGANWTALGAGTRIAGGWELTGLSLPENGSIRARARTPSGRYNASSGLVEQVQDFDNPFPMITSSLTASGTYGATLTDYTITADATPTSYAATDLPAGLSIDTDTGIISGTPTQTGTFNISLTATNGNGSGPSSTLVLTVAKAAVTVTATSGQAKIYGTSDPTLASTITTGALAFDDTLTGALARADGDNVGTYAIAQGTLTAGSNYTLTFVPADFTITAKPVTVTATSGQAKVYGASDPTFASTITDGSLVFDDTFTGALTRAGGEDVGTYAIAQGTFTAGSNYTLTFVPADFTITAKPVTVTATSGQTKVYGASDPTFASTITDGSLVFDDTFTGALTRAGGEDVGTYAIAQGTFTAGSNYTLTFVPANFAITKAVLTVTADNQSRPYRQTNPTLTATLTGFVSGDTTASAVTGAAALSSTADSTSMPGTFPITAAVGALAADNYSFSFVDGTLTVESAYHSTDTDQNWQIGFIELTRVIQLYNTTNGTTRSGDYHNESGTEDGYAPGTGTTTTYHSADTDRNGRISLLELTRVIQLYNTKDDTTRTGFYRPQSGTEDGYTPDHPST